MCKYCEKGKINAYGEEIFPSLPFEDKKCVYHETPFIFKTNNRYFMRVENFFDTKIKGCPMCGRKLEE